MEREVLRAARESSRLGQRDYTHVGISIVLFVIAAVLYLVGYSSVGALVAVGAIVEIGAWAILMNGGRSYPRVEVPPVSEVHEKQRSEGKDAV
jgi:hypothetical protein